MRKVWYRLTRGESSRPISTLNDTGKAVKRMEPEDEVSTPDNEGVVINVDNTPDPEETDAPPVEVEANPTIIVNNITPDPAPEETRAEIEQEVREEDYRDQRIAELEAQVYELTNPAPVEEPTPVEVTDIVAADDETETDGEEDDEGEEEPERPEPKSAGPHTMFRPWGSWFGKDN